MELTKRNIHMNKQRGNASIQMTLDDDFNISDSKQDVEKIVKNQGNVVISEIKPYEGRINIKGYLEFNVLYISAEKNGCINSMKGRINFEEVLNMDNIDSQDILGVKYELEDLLITLVNSRKISVKALITISCTAEELYDEELAVDVSDSNMNDIKCKKRNIEVTQIAINKKDIYRIKEEILLPAGKKNIREILYSDVSLPMAEYRTMDDQLMIKGELDVFVIYSTEEGDFEYIEKEISFNGVMELVGCTTDMIEEVLTVIGNREVIARPDSDGEERIIEVEAVLELDIKTYKEEELEVIDDIYSLTRDVTPKTKKAEYEKILVKNNSKTHVGDRIVARENQPEILLVCNGNANVKIDDIEVNEHGINIEGAVVADIMYISADDMSPLNLVQSTIPYSHLIEVRGITPECFYNISVGVSHVSVIMLGNREMEIKIAINFDTIVFEKITELIISDIDVKELSSENLQKMPGIVGYIVDNGDNLWSIAKKYHSTVERICEINNLEKEEIKTGDKLLIVKEMSGSIA